MNSISNIYEHIRKAKIQAEKDYIKANTIIIDKDIAKTNNLFYNGGMYPPMIMGLKVVYSKNLPDNVNFIISEGNQVKSEFEKFKQLKDDLSLSPLIIFQALENGVYVKDSDEYVETTITHCVNLVFVYNEQYEEFGFGYGYDCYSEKPLWWLSLKDYGRTWSLYKEDLDND